MAAVIADNVLGVKKDTVNEAEDFPIDTSRGTPLLSGEKVTTQSCNTRISSGGIPD